MIELLGSIPREVTVAVSGGVDSMVLLDFLSRNHRVDAAFFHHDTENSNRAHEFLVEFCGQRGIKLHVGHIDKVRPREFSPEEHWREERYQFLRNFSAVVTAHHLDDVAETWIWSSLHGQSSLLPYRRVNVIRPLLCARKYDLESWAVRKSVPWIKDTSNDDLKYTRNYIRHQVMPHALRVNAGLHSMLKKKLVDRQKKDSENS